MNETGRARGNRPGKTGGTRTPTWKQRLTRPPVIIAVVALVAGVVAFALTRPEGPEELSLKEFEVAVAEGRVAGADIADDAREVTGELEDGTRYRVAFPAEYADEVTGILLEADVDTRAQPKGSSLLEDILFNLVPTFLIVGVFLWFVMQMQSGGRSAKFGRARAKQRVDGAGVTFADVAGAEEAVQELAEVTEFLKDPDRFKALGARIPKGVLLCGPPGTGKTLLARAVAGEAGVPFLTISGSDFVEMFVGVGASRVRDLFKQAQEQAPAIVFVDEIDAVGRRRGAGMGGGHDEREQTLNQLLVEMDGFEATAGVILMAATNRPDILDPALLRPGRFDRQVVVDAPDINGRRAILEVHARNKPLAEDVDLAVLARSTPGFTGADLANVVNEGALLAARRGLSVIGQSELNEAVDRVLAGPERRSKVMNDLEKRTVAVHEAGHALVGHALPHADPVHKVSIVARGRALGITMALPEEDRNLHSRSWIEDHLAVLLAGRSAEEVVLGEITTGAADDIDRATKLARDMVTRFGMSEKLGPLRFGSRDDDGYLGRDAHVADYSEDVAARIDSEVSRLIEDAHLRARMLIERHRDELDALTDRLMEVETVQADELRRLFAGVGDDGAPGTIGGTP